MFNPLLNCIAFVTYLLHFWFTEYQISPCFYTKETIHLFKNILGQSLISTLSNIFVYWFTSPMRQLVSWWASGSFSSPAQNLFHLSLFSFFPTDNQNWTRFPQRIQHWYYLPAFKWFQCNFQFFVFLFFFFLTALKQCVRLSRLFWAVYPHCVHSFIELSHQFIPHEPNFAGVSKIYHNFSWQFEHTDPIRFCDMKWAWLATSFLNRPLESLGVNYPVGRSDLMLTYKMLADMENENEKLLILVKKELKHLVLKKLQGMVTYR